MTLQLNIHVRLLINRTFLLPGRPSCRSTLLKHRIVERRVKILDPGRSGKVDIQRRYPVLVVRIESRKYERRREESSAADHGRNSGYHAVIVVVDVQSGEEDRDHEEGEEHGEEQLATFVRHVGVSRAEHDVTCLRNC